MRMRNKKYYIVWIEGLDWFYGEKIKTLDGNDHTYTLKMTKAMRVKPKDVGAVKEELRRQGIASWCLDNPNTWVPTSYAPKGTIFNIEDIK